MMLDKETIKGLNWAFDEAKLCGAEFDKERRIVGLTLSVVCLHPDGTIPEDRRVQVILEPVGRLCASLRNGRWDDAKAEVVPFTPEQLIEKVKEFGGLPIYGWEFFDAGDKKFDEWKDRLSLNYESGNDGKSHTLYLFQDTDRILDIRIWFDTISFFTPAYEEISMSDFISAGKRAWDAIMLQRDKQVQDAFGIYPLPAENEKKDSG